VPGGAMGRNQIKTEKKNIEYRMSNIERKTKGKKTEEKTEFLEQDLQDYQDVDKKTRRQELLFLKKNTPPRTARGQGLCLVYF
jgi:hypothetical protein